VIQTVVRLSSCCSVGQFVLTMQDLDTIFFFFCSIIGLLVNLPHVSVFSCLVK